MAVNRVAQSSLLRWWLLGLAVLVLIGHGVDCSHDFLNWDDPDLLTKFDLLNPATRATFTTAWTSPVKGLYTPLAYTLWGGLTLVGRVETPDIDGVTLNPIVFHGLNVLLHLACVLIVFDLLQRLLRHPRTKDESGRMKDEKGESGSSPVPFRSSSFILHPYLPSFLGAAIFAVHPIQVEPVAWVSGMNNLLAGLWVIACLDAYVIFAKSESKLPWQWYVGSLILLAMALLSKPTAIVAPLMIVAIDWLVIARPFRRVVRDSAAFFALMIPFAIVGRRVQPAIDVVAPAWRYRAVIAGDAIGFYLHKIAWPSPLIVDYGRTPAWVLAHGGSMPVWITLAVALAVVLIFSRFRWVLGCAAIFIAGIAPVLGWVPFDFQINSTVADRYVYLSMLGVAMAVAIVLAKLRPGIAAVAGAIVILPLTFLCVRQSQVWRNNFTLTDHCLADNRQSLVAHKTIGDTYLRAGNYPMAEHHYREGLKTRPTDPLLNFHLADLLMLDENRPAEAIPYYQAAFAANYREPAVFNNYGMALSRVHLDEPAIAIFEFILSKHPDDLKARTNLGYTLADQGQYDQAEAQLRQVLAANPNSIEARQGLAQIAAVRAQTRPIVSFPFIQGQK